MYCPLYHRHHVEQPSKAPLPLALLSRAELQFLKSTNLWGRKEELPQYLQFKISQLYNLKDAEIGEFMELPDTTYIVHLTPEDYSLMKNGCYSKKQVQYTSYLPPRACAGPEDHTHVHGG